MLSEATIMSTRPPTRIVLEVVEGVLDQEALGPDFAQSAFVKSMSKPLTLPSSVISLNGG